MKRLATGLVTALLIAATPAWADSWKNERGHGNGYRQTHWDHRSERGHREHPRHWDRHHHRRHHHHERYHHYSPRQHYYYRDHSYYAPAPAYSAAPSIYFSWSSAY